MYIRAVTYVQTEQQLIEQNDYEANLPVQDYRSVYVVVRDSRKDSTSKISIKMAVKNISSTPITKVNIYTVIDDKMSLSKIRRKIDVMADKHETINDYSEEMKFWIQHFYEKREVYKKCGITDDNGFSDLLSS